MSRRIETILESRRTAARRALELRRERAFDVCPELLSMEYELAEAGLRANRELLDGALGADGAREAIAAAARGLSHRRAVLLAAAGFPADYLELAPECRLCGDTGLVTGDGGLPERCNCYYALLRDHLAAVSGVPAARNAGFADFNASLFADRADAERYGHIESPRANILRIRDSALRFVRALSEGAGQSLYFYGKTGTGKTFIATAIAGELTRLGVSVLYRSAPDIFNVFTEHRMRALRDEAYSDAFYRHIFDVELLIIDDLGVETATSARYSEFVTLLNERLAPSGGSRPRSTVISTNMDLTTLRKTYDERIFSRIFGAFQIVEFYGDDVRLIKKGFGHE